MTTINIDKQKVQFLVFATLNQLSDSGLHPAEIVIAMSECAGRVIAAMDNDIAQRELLDLAIKQMSGAILAQRSNIILPN